MLYTISLVELSLSCSVASSLGDRSPDHSANSRRIGLLQGLIHPAHLRHCPDLWFIDSCESPQKLNDATMRNPVWLFSLNRIWDSGAPDTPIGGS